MSLKCRLRGEELRLPEGFSNDLNQVIRVAKALNKCTDVEEVYQVALDFLTDQHQVNMVMVYLMNEEKSEAVLQAHKNVPADYVVKAGRIPYPTGPTWKVIKSGQIIKIEDIRKGPGSKEFEGELGDYRALGIPISAENSTIGVIWLLTQKHRKFDQNGLRILSFIGEQFATAIAKARQTDELKERNEYLSILSEVSQVIHKSSDLKQIFKTILSLTRDLKFVDLLSVYLVEEEEGSREAVLQIQEGYPREYLDKASRIPYGRGVTWKVITDGESVFYEDASDPSTPVGPAGKALGARALLSIPLKSGDETIGTIDFSRYEKNSFTRQELDFLSSLGNQVGTAIAKAKMLEEMRKRKTALRQSEQRYKDLFENIPSGIYRTTPDGRIIMANPALIRMLGYSSFDELAKRDLEEEGFDTDYPRSKFKEIIEQKGEISGLESAWLKNDGSPVYVLESTRVVRKEDGTILYYEGTVEDITERKRTEESLTQLATAIEHAADAVEVTDAEGRIEYVNPMFERITGYTRSEVLGRTTASLLSSSAVDQVCHKALLDTISAGNVWSGSLIGKRKDGSQYHQDVTVSPVRDLYGSIKNFVAVRRDVTDRRRVEQALRESLDQLSKKNRYETIISSVTRSVHKSIDLQNVLSNAVEAMSQNIDKADMVGIYLVEGDQAVLRANKGLTEQYIERAGKINYPKGLTWKVILEERPIYCGDVDHDKIMGQAGKELGIKSYLCIPIRFESKTVGTMGINSFEKNAFDEDELRLLGIIARQIEVAISNARYVEALRQSQEELRKTRDELEIRVEKRTVELATANEALREVKEKLEQRVWERTKKLSKTNEELKKEILWRVQAEKALRENEEKYRTLVEHTYDLIAETSMDGRFLYTSPKHRDALGYTAEELFGQTVFDYIHPEDRSGVATEFQRAMNTLSSGSAVFRFKHKNGDWRWLESTGKPFVTAAGEIRGVISSRDITDRKLAEEQIRESLKEKEVLLKEIHHRVKNNLQVISSLISIQSQYTKSRKTVEMFNETQNRIRSMALIHEQLYQSNNMAMIKFSEYVKNLLMNLLYSYEINPDAIKVRVNIDSVFLNIDTAIPCGLIINELVSNSIKHAFPSGNRGEIRVELFPGNGVEGASMSPHFTLIVSDNGCGLPKDLDFRNTNSLGLQLVMDLVEQIGGTINLDRTAGTNFKIEFAEL